ncbi:hypothetical protein CK203_102920 [Vitis vinifera]|uniref:DUF4219 domain-containing protein n=1 Tax=Vitis vinifera TaxID=29760 RepID=A0A438FGG5_VITVI|nr:hypothetical protein CK203_102920 [Vitis vinifera]
METYLEALDLWEAVKEDYDIPALPNNPTMAQIKAHKEKKKMKKSKAKACLFAAVSPTIFTRIMSLKTAKAIWDYLKQEYAEDERMKEKILVTVPERYEATVTTLENTKDLSKISLAELLNSLQAQEQRRLMRQDVITDGALQAKHHGVEKNKKKNKKNKKKKKKTRKKIVTLQP